ncbi:hypothetical protein ACP70R_037133 [Stipagrostis hirtigluma subsp. patula]
MPYHLVPKNLAYQLVLIPRGRPLPRLLPTHPTREKKKRKRRIHGDGKERGDPPAHPLDYPAGGQIRRAAAPPHGFPGPDLVRPTPSAPDSIRVDPDLCRPASVRPDSGRPASTPPCPTFHGFIIGIAQMDKRTKLLIYGAAAQMLIYGAAAQMLIWMHICVGWLGGDST